MNAIDRTLLIDASERRGCLPPRAAPIVCLVSWLLACGPALAETWSVGAGQPFATLDDLSDAVDLAPGDIVEVAGGTESRVGERTKADRRRPSVLRYLSTNG